MTDTDIEFGDIEPDDAWDETETIAPEQVALRLHELRVAVDQLAGRDPAEWDALDPVEQDLAVAIGEVVVSWIVQRRAADNSPAELAEHLHNVNVWLSRGRIPTWPDLEPPERDLAVALMELVVDWLEREGPR